MCDYQFQGINREIDLSIVKVIYSDLTFTNDFIGPIGSYDWHFVSAAPLERKEYLTLVRPFDSYTWAFIAASLVGVSISLILIDKISAMWSTESAPIFQSNNKWEK